MPDKNIKFDEYVQTSSPEDKLECIEKFNTVWNNVPPNSRKSLMTIHRVPGLWVGEATD